MSKNESNVGLLVMHYGTPASMDEVLPYYTHIRRGRPPTAEQLADLVGRYEAIGGPSPLAHISERQAEAIQEAMARRGVDAKLYIGAKHTKPFVADVVRTMADDGIDHAVAIVLAPHYSSFSVAVYRKYAFDALEAARSTMHLEFIERWGALPAYISALAERIKAQVTGLDLTETLVTFSAHSLPEKIMADGDPYREELLETSTLVAEAVSAPNWAFAFQSASQTGEPWLGPDILDVIRQNAAKYRTIVSCTVGFVSDHLEVLYDLGIEAREECAKLGLEFRLASTLGAEPKVMDALGQLAVDRLKQPV